MINRKLIAGSAAILLFLIVYLLSDMGVLSVPQLAFSSETKGPVIATVISTENSVQLRQNKTLYWQEARAGRDLTFYDSILTFEDSISQLKLKDGTEIEIQPNTLVMLEPPESSQKNLKLVLMRGEVKVLNGESQRVLRAPTPLRLTGASPAVELRKRAIVTQPVQKIEVTLKPEPTMPQEPGPVLPPPQKQVRAKPQPEPQELDEPIPQLDFHGPNAPEPVAATKAEPLPQEPLRKNYWVWAGSGVNYLNYGQTVNNLSDVSYESLKGPSYYARGGGYISQLWALEGTYKNSPGEVASSATITVRNGSYNWQTFTAEAIRTMTDGEHYFLGQDLYLGLRAGIQHHIVPFLVTLPTGGAEVRENTLTMASAGFDLLLGKLRKVRFDINGRYQYPVMTGASNGNSFEIQPTFGFDGSVGGIYKMFENFFVGGYWYGQWHNYKFTYKDGATGRTNKGSQSLFYSNVEGRLGYEF